MKNNEKNHFKLFVSGSLVSFVGVIAIGVINFLIRRRLALTLTIEDFGFLYACFSFCMIFNAYLDLGLAQSATILISGALSRTETKRANSYYNYFLLVKFLIASAIIVILFITHKFWVDTFFKYKETLPFLIIISLILFQSLKSAPVAVATALKKFVVLNIANVLNVAVVLLVILIADKGSMLSASIAFPVGTIVLFVVLSVLAYFWGFVPKLSALMDVSAISPMFHLTKWVAISMAGLSTMYYMDSMFLTYFKGLQAVALYNIVLPIVQIAQSLIIIPSVFLPIVSDLWIKKENKIIGDICRLITDATFYFLWPVTIMLILMSSDIITILFSDKFIAASNALVILFIGVVFFCIASFYMGTLNSGGKAKTVSLIIIIAVIMNIVLNFFLVPAFSINGAALATAFSYLFIFVCFYKVLRRLLKGAGQINVKMICMNASMGILGIIFSILFVGSSMVDRLLFLGIFILLYFILTIPSMKKFIVEFMTVWSETSV